MQVRYRRLSAHPEGVHRVREVLFDRAVNDGVAEVPEAQARELTSRCQGCGAYNAYEVVVPELEPVEVVTQRRPGRPKKA